MSVSWIYHGHGLQQRDTVLPKHPSPPFHPESPPQEGDYTADHVHEHQHEHDDGDDDVTEVTQRHQGPCFPWGWDQLSQQSQLPVYENIYALPLDHPKYPLGTFDAHMPGQYISSEFKQSPDMAGGHHIEHHIYSHTTISHSPNMQPIFPSFDAGANGMPHMMPAEDSSSASDYMETREPSPQQYGANTEVSVPSASPPYAMSNINAPYHYPECPTCSDGTSSVYTPCGSLYPSPTPLSSAPSPGPSHHDAAGGSHRPRQSSSPHLTGRLAANNRRSPSKRNGTPHAACGSSPLSTATQVEKSVSPAATVMEAPLIHSSPEGNCEFAAPRPVVVHKIPKVLRGDKPRARSEMESYVDFANPPDLLEPLKDEPSEPPPEDMNPSDPTMVPRLQDVRFDKDLYTPKWVRGYGNKREGWCGICKPGRWLVLKNSAFWYDKSFTHGVSATTGLAFSAPKQIRRTEGSTNIWEGQCTKCDKWVGLVSNKKKGTTWFRHAYKCHNNTSSSGVKPVEPLKRKRDDSPGEQQPSKHHPQPKASASKPSKKRPAVPAFSAATGINGAASQKAKKTKVVKKASS